MYFDPKKFKAESPISLLKKRMWERGGVTAGRKLPTVQRFKKDTVLAGYAGKDGCFSAQFEDGRIRVEIFSQDPKTVAVAKETPAPVATTVLDETPGWGFDAIHILKEALRK